MTDALHNLLSGEVIERVKQLELFSRLRVRGARIGDNRSTVMGVSPEFVQHRPYLRGDNPRHIDWRVLAKSDRLVVKRFEEFTNASATIVLDTSASMGYRGAGLSKLDFAVRCAGVLTYLMLQQRDAFSLAEFAGDIAGWIEPGSSRRHMARVFERLVTLESQGPTRIVECLNTVHSRLHGRGIVMVLSDFMDDPASIASALGRLRAAGSDVIAFQVFDPSEQDLDFVDFTQFRDVEDNSIVAVDPLLIREQYRELFGQHIESLRSRCLSFGVDFAPLPVGDNFDILIADYLRRRRPAL